MTCYWWIQFYLETMHGVFIDKCEKVRITRGEKMFIGDRTENITNEGMLQKLQ